MSNQNIESKRNQLTAILLSAELKFSSICQSTTIILDHSDKEEYDKKQSITSLAQSPKEFLVNNTFRFLPIVVNKLKELDCLDKGHSGESLQFIQGSYGTYKCSYCNNFYKQYLTEEQQREVNLFYVTPMTDFE